MRHKPRRFTAALIVFSLFFQLLPLPALANGGRRSLIRAPEPTAAGALRAPLKTNESPRRRDPMLDWIKEIYTMIEIGRASCRERV